MPWLLPTHNRPELCERALRCIHAAGCTTPVHVLVNGGSSETRHAYARVIRGLGEEGFYFIAHEFADNLGLCGAMRWFFEQYPDEPWYGIMTDDEFVQSPGFDAKLVEAAG